MNADEIAIKLVADFTGNTTREDSLELYRMVKAAIEQTQQETYKHAARLVNGYHNPNTLQTASSKILNYALTLPEAL